MPHRWCRGGHGARCLLRTRHLACTSTLLSAASPRFPSAGPALDAPSEVAELQREVELLRGKVDSHPEVKRFAVENLHLSEVGGRALRCVRGLLCVCGLLCLSRWWGGGVLLCGGGRVGALPLLLPLLRPRR